MCQWWPGSFSLKDLAADVGGSLLAAAFILLVERQFGAPPPVAPASPPSPGAAPTGPWVALGLGRAPPRLVDLEQVGGKEPVALTFFIHPMPRRLQHQDAAVQCMPCLHYAWVD